MPRATPLPIEAIAPRQAIATTRTRSAYVSLRERIIEGLLAPGSKLNIAQLAIELEVSPGAVREALAMLEADALVASEPQRGWTVMPISASDVQMLTRARIEVEKLCLFESMAEGGIEWESTVVAALHRLSRLQGQTDSRGRMSREWTQAHETFHRALAGGCRNHWLLKMRELLYHQSERYRQFSARREKGTRDVDAEHKAIGTAALAHDRAKLGKLIEEHLRHTEALVLEGLARRRSAA